MFSHPRQRRGPYALAGQSTVLPSVIRTGVLLLIIGFVLYFIGNWILWMFGAGNQVERTSVLLMVEPRGPVNVSLEGGAVQRAEDSLKLYAGDKVSTGNGAFASLLFFDGSRARLDQQTDIMLARTTKGTASSFYDIELSRGSVHLRTPATEAFSGSILRTIHTPLLTLAIPPGTELLAGASALTVFDSQDLGVGVTVEGATEPIVIGEGQTFSLPENADVGGNLYAFRTVIDASALDQTFIAESRAAVASFSMNEPVATALQTDILTVTEPAQGFVAAASTVTVAGKVGKGVTRVRVNGYAAPIDPTDGSFRQELSIAEDEETDIRIEALDASGIVLQEMRRVVRRNVTLPDTPAIMSPGKSGETYRTLRAEFEIRGTAASDAAGIAVNDYRLQLYKPGSRSWSYLASTSLGNLVPGKNAYSVVAVDAAGNRSAPAMITILFEEGTEGVVATSGEGTDDSSAAAQGELPQNDPIKPGSLGVTGPTAGLTHTATGGELLIVGTTDPATASIWVNDYRLQLYKPGKTTWNYIASVELRNMRRGKNTYTIVARNEQNEILDRVEYVVNY